MLRHAEFIGQVCPTLWIPRSIPIKCTAKIRLAISTLRIQTLQR